jgi:hypothetical protein
MCGEESRSKGKAMWLCDLVWSIIMVLVKFSAFVVKTSL